MRTAVYLNPEDCGQAITVEAAGDTGIYFVVTDRASNFRMYLGHEDAAKLRDALSLEIDTVLARRHDTAHHLED